MIFERLGVCTDTSLLLSDVGKKADCRLGGDREMRCVTESWPRTFRAYNQIILIPSLLLESILDRKDDRCSLWSLSVMCSKCGPAVGFLGA